MLGTFTSVPQNYYKGEVLMNDSLKVGLIILGVYFVLTGGMEFIMNSLVSLGQTFAQAPVINIAIAGLIIYVISKRK